MANKVRVDIDGKQTVSKAAKEAEGGLRSLKDTTAGLKKESQDLVAPVTNLRSAFAAIAGPVGLAVAGIKTFSAVLGKAMELGAEGAKLQQTEAAFRSLAATAGQSANSVLASLREASRGTVAEMDLIASAAKASLYKLPLENLDKLMMIARASARATGESVQKMFDDIVIGIARGSPMILDNLGITIKLEEAYQAYARQLGKTAEQLTAAEKSQALLHATIDSGMATVDGMGESMKELSDSERIDSAKAAFVNLKNELAEGLAPAIATVNTGLAEMFNWIRDLVNATPRLKELSLSMPGVNVKKLEAEYGTLVPGGTLQSWIDRNKPAALAAGLGGGRAPVAGAGAAAVYQYDPTAYVPAYYRYPNFDPITDLGYTAAEFGEAFDTAEGDTYALAEALDEARSAVSNFADFLRMDRADTRMVAGGDARQNLADYLRGDRMYTTPAEGATTGGAATGAMLGDVGGLAAAFAEMLMSVKSITLLMDPIATMLQATLEVIGPLIDTALAPLVGIFVVLGQLIGALLVPVIQALTPVIDAVAKSFVWLYNNIIRPVGIVIYKIFTGLAGMLSVIVNAVIDVINTFRRPSRQIEHWEYTPGSAEEALPEISYGDLLTAGGEAISGAGGSSYTSGSQTTVEHQPDIYVTINIDGNILGAGGRAELGKEIGRALEAYAGIGGRIHIQGALT